MAYEDFVGTWVVIFVDQTNMAQKGGTLTISGPENDIKFMAENMGQNNDDWNEASHAYDPSSNQIVGEVGPAKPPNPYVMATAGRVLLCSIGSMAAQAHSPQYIGPDADGEAGSWTASDGGGQVDPAS